MPRGRPESDDPRCHQVRFRLTANEMRRLEADALDVGIGPALLARRRSLDGRLAWAAPAHGGDSHLRTQLYQLLRQSGSEIRRVGINLNQIARALNGGERLGKAEQDAGTAIVRVLPVLEAATQRILDSMTALDPRHGA